MAAAAADSYRVMNLERHDAMNAGRMNRPTIKLDHIPRPRAADRLVGACADRVGGRKDLEQPRESEPVNSLLRLICFVEALADS